MRAPWILGLALALAGCPSSADDDDDAAACVATGGSDAAACVDAAAYAADLEHLAVVRSPGTAGHDAARAHCATVLGDLGFTVEEHAYGSGTNVVGVKAGTDATRQVIVSAHYDSVADCEGADDNASGVAGALGVARALASGTWTQDLVVACWDEEERGLIGSEAYAARAAGADQSIDVAVSLEMIGYKSTEADSQALPLGFDQVFPAAAEAVAANENKGDFIALVADPASVAWVDAFFGWTPSSLSSIRVDIPENLLGSPLIADLSRSDHAAFWGEGFPAVMVTDTADFRYPGYHCADGSDSVARLDLEFAVDVTRATAAATAARLSAE